MSSAAATSMTEATIVHTPRIAIFRSYAAAAVACSFSAGQYKGELAKKWIAYCKQNIPIAKGRTRWWRAS